MQKEHAIYFRVAKEQFAVVRTATLSLCNFVFSLMHRPLPASWQAGRRKIPGECQRRQVSGTHESHYTEDSLVLHCKTT